MAISADKLASMVTAVYLHKDPADFITNEEELQMWNTLVKEVADIVNRGDSPYFEDWTG